MTMLNEVSGVVAAWLATYALHSTLLLGAAWLANRKLALGVSRRDVIWKAATVGGLITATLQSALIGWNQARPLGGRYALTPATEWVQPIDLPAAPMNVSDLAQSSAASAIEAATSPITSRSDTTARNYNYPLSWPETLVLLWLTGFVVQAVRLRQRRR